MADDNTSDNKNGDGTMDTKSKNGTLDLSNMQQRVNHLDIKLCTSWQRIYSLEQLLQC